MIVTKSVEKYKRQKFIDRLKQQYVIRMQEYREEKKQIALKERDDKNTEISKWKQRKYVRSFLQEKMKIEKEVEPISAPFKLQKEID